MSEVTWDARGLLIKLDHDETTKLLETLGAGAASGPALLKLLIVLGVSATAAPYVAGALALHFAWELATIKFMDKGLGVYLTVPQIILVGAPGVVIPSTVSGDIADPNNWAHVNSGTFQSPGGDQIGYNIERGTGAPDDVRFILRNECPSGWEKEFIFFPGDGQKWPVFAGDHDQNDVSQWAQYMGTVSIEFWKPVGPLAQWIHIGLTLRNFSPLGSGDVVTFTWTKD